MDAINKLKQKTINDYLACINKLSKGYRVDYSLILHEISFIETHTELDNCDFIYQYLMSA